jgi:hypothetical protein
MPELTEEEYAEMGRKMHAALMRSARNTRFNRTYFCVDAGWSAEQFDHWVQTGESPGQQESNSPKADVT